VLSTHKEQVKKGAGAQKKIALTGPNRTTELGITAVNSMNLNLSRKLVVQQNDDCKNESKMF